jgi:hypothetical protein
MTIYIMNAEIRENTTAAFLNTTASFGEECQKLHVVFSSDTSRFHDADRGLTLKTSLSMNKPVGIPRPTAILGHEFSM